MMYLTVPKVIPAIFFQSYPGSRRSRNKAMIPARGPQTSLGLGTQAIHDSKTLNEWPTTIETDIENNQELKISTEIQDIDRKNISSIHYKLFNPNYQVVLLYPRAWLPKTKTFFMNKCLVHS